MKHVRTRILAPWEMTANTMCQPKKIHTPTQLFPQNITNSAKCIGERKSKTACETSLFPTDSRPACHFGPREIFCCCPVRYIFCAASARLSTWPCCPAHKNHSDTPHHTTLLHPTYTTTQTHTHVLRQFIKVGRASSSRGPTLLIIPSPFPSPWFLFGKRWGQTECR